MAVPIEERVAAPEATDKHFATEADIGELSGRMDALPRRQRDAR